MSETLLAQLISAKFSHELSGVLGAIKNSVELIDAPNALVKDQSVKLASYASMAAVSRLKFLRALYGYCDPNEQFDCNKLLSLAKDFFRGRDIEVSLEGDSKLWTRGSYAKLLLCIVVLSQSHFQQGGCVSIRIASPSSSIVAIGEGLAMPSSMLLETLTSPSKKEKMSIFNVHEHYSKRLADSLGVKIKVESSCKEVAYVLLVE